MEVMASEIENHVRQRRPQAATKLIRQFLKSKKRPTDALFIACDWYRRLGLYLEGYRLLEATGLSFMRVSTKSTDGLKLLWAARFLNLLGSGKLALNIVQHLSVSTAQEHLIIGNIYLVNFCFIQAQSHFESMLNNLTSLPDYTGRLALISYADSLAGLGKFSQAIDLVSRVLKMSNEPLLHGIALQARGEYNARRDKFKEAIADLEKAMTFFPQGEATADRGVLCKWTGFVHGQLGAQQKSKKFFSEAEKILMRPNIPPEAWLDIFRLKLKLGLLSDVETKNLLSYPGLADGFQAQLPKMKRTLIGENLQTTKIWTIDLDRSEYFFQDKNHLGLPKEIHLLALIRLSGKWGLSMERTKNLLWPEEAFSYEQLEPRLEKLIQRIRQKYQVSIDLKASVLRISTKDLSKIRVWIGGKDSRPSFLCSKSEFTGGDLSQYYEISRSHRAQVIKDWIHLGYIKPLGREPRLRYIVTPCKTSTQDL